eukprot:4856435-Pleurochrysis_carterae.AAC.1
MRASYQESPGDQRKAYGTDSSDEDPDRVSSSSWLADESSEKSLSDKASQPSSSPSAPSVFVPPSTDSSP